MSAPSSSSRRKTRKIRYHDREWDEIVAHARASGLPPATFVRKVSLGVKPRARRNRTENELILRLGGIASDLRHLVRLAERAGDPPALVQIQVVLDETLVAIRRIG